MKGKLDALFLLRFSAVTPRQELTQEWNSLNDLFHQTNKEFLEAFSDFSFSEAHRKHAELVAINAKMEYLQRMIEGNTYEPK